MTRALIAVALFVGLAQNTCDSQAAQTPLGLNRFNPQAGTWTEDPDAPHTYSKRVTGEAAHGEWIVYVMIDPGAWINWHWHSNPQNMFGVSGTMEYEIKPAPKFKFGAGSFAIVPAHAVHNGQCVSKEPCYFFIENLLPNDKHMTDENGVEREPHR
jgi:quercetin dioxygenase-like cupin family protein